MSGQNTRKVVGNLFVHHKSRCASNDRNDHVAAAILVLADAVFEVAEATCSPEPDVDNSHAKTFADNPTSPVFGQELKALHVEWDIPSEESGAEHASYIDALALILNDLLDSKNSVELTLEDVLGRRPIRQRLLSHHGLKFSETKAGRIRISRACDK